MNVDTIAEQLLFTTLRIETHGNGNIGTGTGFFFNYDLGSGKTAPFVVTNKHVVDGWKTGVLTFHTSHQGQLQLGKPYALHITDFDRLWFMHPDPVVDVAVAPVAAVFAHLASSGTQVFYRGVDQSLIPTSSQLLDLDALEEVVFIGYPAPVWDTVNFLPVIRRGSTATPLSVDYMGRKQFLIDASVFPGSSGSPVFLLNLGIHHDRKGNAVVGNRVHLLGIVAGVHIRESQNRIVMVPAPTASVPAAIAQTMINLGIVFKASTIEEAIRGCLASRGIPISQQGPPTPPASTT